MTIHLNNDGFLIAGPVSFANVAHLKKQGEHAIAVSTQSHCVIDLSEMKDQDASSLSLLLCFMRFAAKKNKKIEFVHVPSSVKRMQHLFGLGA
jgi:phospholipid transport system transporter-binding protein